MHRLPRVRLLRPRCFHSPGVLRRTPAWAFAAVALCFGFQPAIAAEPTGPLRITDQFENIHGLDEFEGDVVILVYGDRRSTKVCRDLGERLHVTFHPGAEGQDGADGFRAPVRPVSGQAGEGASPEVRVVPIACTGKIPKPLQKPILSQFRKAVPDVPVWLDFDNEMKRRFGLKDGVPNILLFDSKGELRLEASGVMDQAAFDELVGQVEELRREAAASR